MGEEPGGRGAAVPWRCSLDRSCSYESDALAIDTSHVCLLVRAADRLAVEEPLLSDRFQELLASHECAGRHRLMSSLTLLSHEREMNLASPDCALRLYGQLPIGALDPIESVDAGAGDDLPEGLPGERDRTLAAAAVAVSNGAEQTVMVVTDDESLGDWIAEIAAGMSDIDVALLPASSVDLLGRMHACGSIGTSVVMAVGDAETAHLNIRVMDAGLRQRKLARLNQMVVAAATRDAKRGVGYERY
jgi:hypothetical protein